MMVTPPFLAPKDTVGIISTARKISKEDLEPLLDIIEIWDIRYRLGDSIGAAADQYAGDDELRTKDLQKMMDDPTIKAIWCARGGYGTVRLIDHLDFSEFKKHPKWIIGYSDITVLHSHIHGFGIETLHANMAIDIDTKSEATRSTLHEALFGKSYSIEYASEAPENRIGEAQGQLIGGNLSLLYSLMGSPSEISTNGKILFIEDLDEMLYHVDRMMQNLKRNGWLENLAGLVVGGMNDMRDNTIPFGKTATTIISETVADYNYPVCFDFPAGHIQDNRALIMGREVCFAVTKHRIRLDFLK